MGRGRAGGQKINVVKRFSGPLKAMIDFSFRLYKLEEQELAVEMKLKPQMGMLRDKMQFKPMLF